MSTTAESLSDSPSSSAPPKPKVRPTFSSPGPPQPVPSSTLLPSTILPPNPPTKPHYTANTPPLHPRRQLRRRHRDRHNLPLRIPQNPHPTQLPPPDRRKNPLPPLRPRLVRRLHHPNHRQQPQSRHPLRRLRLLQILTLRPLRENLRPTHRHRRVWCRHYRVPVGGHAV